MKLAELQQAFLNDLMGTDQGSLESAVLDDGSVALATRLGIYRNAYHTRLREALATDHEMLQLYVGEEAFAEIANDYVTATPSQGFSLRYLGEGLPQFLKGHERYGQLPVLSHLARFERLLLSAFDAADDPQLEPPALAALAPEQWPGLALQLHPGVHVVELRYGAVEIWQALKNQQTPPDALSESAGWLVFRNRQRLTEFRSLDRDELSLLTMAREGAPFSELCSQLLHWHDGADAATRAAQLIQTWVADGLVSGFDQTLG